MRVLRIEGYISGHLRLDPAPETAPEYVELLQIKTRVLDLLAEADNLARRLRIKCEAASVDSPQ